MQAGNRPDEATPDDATPDDAKIVRRRSSTAMIGGVRLGAWSCGVLVFMVLNWFLLFGSQSGLILRGTNNIGHQAGYFIAFGLAVAALVLTQRFRDVATGLPVSLAVAFGWCWLSVGWSIDPGTSVRKLLLTTMIAVTTLVSTRLIGSRRTIGILRINLALSVVVSLLAVAAIPDIGIQHQIELADPEGLGAWKGIFVDKNVCGAISALTIMAFLFGPAKVRRPIALAVILCSVVLLIGSKSKTAMGIAGIAVAVGAVFRFYDPRFRPFLIPAALAVVALLLVSLNVLIDPFRRALYDPSAFTGRGMIWAMVYRYVQDHWWFGAGYGAFWGSVNSPVFTYTKEEWLQTIVVGHSGYLDLWAQVGAIGLALIVVASLLAPLVQLLKSLSLSTAERQLFIAWLVFIAGDNLTESQLFDRDTVLTVTSFFIIALIGTGEGQTRRIAGPPAARPLRRRGIGLTAGATLRYRPAP